jgi:hypothetical protein
MEDRKKLLARPVESDTKIIRADLVDLGEFPALMELWVWEGITASSFVVLKKDLGQRSIDQLIDFCFEKIKQPRDPQTTSKEVGEYIYINYAFVTD